MIANICFSTESTQHSLFASLLFTIKASTFLLDALVGAYVIYQSKKIQQTLQEGLLGANM
jgi:hypothetical protein